MSSSVPLLNPQNLSQSPERQLLIHRLPFGVEPVLHFPFEAFVGQLGYFEQGLTGVVANQIRVLQIAHNGV